MHTIEVGVLSLLLLNNSMCFWNLKNQNFYLPNQYADGELINTADYMLENSNEFRALVTVTCLWYSQPIIS